MVKPIVIFVTLCLAFLVYSGIIYIGSANHTLKSMKSKVSSSKGKLIWQKYNCQSCHQIYSLGGYLGPDLTNVYSKYKKNPEVLKLFMKGGFKQMPTFILNQQEEKHLLDFFKELDKTGKSDHRTFRILKDGMISQDGKQ